MKNIDTMLKTQPMSFPPDLSIHNHVVLIRNLNMPAMVFDNSFKLLGVNDAFQRTFSMSFDDLITSGIRDFFGNELFNVLTFAKEDSMSASHGAQTQMIETEFEKKDRFYKLTQTAVKNSQSAMIGHLLFFIDMTREKMLEQVRADFTSMIVHDLRSPLTAIMGNLELLYYEAEETASPDIKELFTDSLEQSQRLLNMINDLLDISKIESGKFTLNLEQVSPGEVIVYAVRSMEPLAVREKIDIELALEPELPIISADKDKLIQVLINIISNAIKFTPAEGLVQIHGKKISDPQIKRNWLLISVSDTGEGISEENIPRLFQKYSQVGARKQRLIKGTGLGLFIVKELVEAHKGEVHVVSRHGVGSCFSLLFPIGDIPDL